MMTDSNDKILENRAKDADILNAIDKLSGDMDELKNDLRFYIKKTETGIIQAAYSGLEKNAIDILSESYKEEIKTVMEIIAGDCPMIPGCSDKFASILNSMISDYRKGDLNGKKAEEYRETLLKMRESAPYASCSNCFDKNQDIFDKSIKRCGSFKEQFSGKNQDGPDLPLQEIDAESIVSSFLDPLANRHRFKVMQELYCGPKSFSELSEATGLKGGNLLFHLEKLLKASMILQKQERGVYVLSLKGAGALKVCAGPDVPQ
ncbi:winged helix-turn-helix transcriptional regulator [Methanoplanus sp. FWC-SCC4]|uniref:Winged helix-turn-helix transcriptional regulator n=1 Tax=Methanochimaera problematica TaxID=2609417 RepID=A0AA97I583_9EURY|nr:winged helix-turn-helix domain-containing protein [Methanoplanus sp. FWC-SCC4]WOF17189.1 winged helix-turn-helix transcriptional regulator [Methanoplanus sp. FWC-SCC4]